MLSAGPRTKAASPCLAVHPIHSYVYSLFPSFGHFPFPTLTTSLRRTRRIPFLI
jgi:hypothetical protein